MSPVSARMSPVTTSTLTEVLPPALTKGRARAVETQAKRHWRTATRSVCQFAADLRRLQDGQAHLVRGFENFGTYAEHTFDGLSAAAAKQLSRQGAVLLLLERQHRIVLEGRGANLPGTTALRRLSAIHANHGEEAMLAVYDHAVTLRPGRSIAETTVKQAEHALMRPTRTELPTPAVSDDEEPCYPDDTEPYDPAAIPEDLRAIARDLDDMLAGLDDATPEQHEDIQHELAAIRQRLDRFTRRRPRASHTDTR